MSLYKLRVAGLEDILQQDVIDMKLLREFCFNGIPDCSSLRSLCWKLLLGYLGPKRETWSATFVKKRELYKQFIDEMVIPPGEQNGSGLVDHPLSDGPESNWNTFFKDNEVLLQIDKDVRRLCPDISFFQQATEFPCPSVVNRERKLHVRVAPTTLSSANVERKGLGMTKINLITKRATESYEAMDEGREAHWEVVERILFIYAKLNPGQGYVQGMNEIIGPIYYVMASDPNIAYRQYAEADCFFCFTALMGEIRDFFIKTLDESEGGIKGMMARLSNMLKEKDGEVWTKLKDQELYPQYYSFRWLTLLLSQEFPLPDVLRIWDSVFADEKRYDFLVKICCAMIVLLREQILVNDFANNVKLLQNFPPMDVKVILKKATSFD
ncbi:TBC1 domain family member 13 [Toxorhynchites rutilus septentrionalis]|uniref:TBC1 domain family member 13 n=1 Tax=Toxorhynchites rutilus septentrionalis TaxID=329112 RepID=UPI00247ACBE4|nr:TBC1 domain family member 13 [Toxorhynchites rutilus septentrionalis]XP_055631517.1 TBC1 domain family member 13 [Toxorhynchites rutilus septentrionalis]